MVTYPLIVYVSTFGTCWDDDTDTLPNIQAEDKILKNPHEDLGSYLVAVEQLKSNVRFFNSNKSFKTTDGVLDHANGLLAKAILKLEDAFKQLLLSYRFVLVQMSAYVCCVCTVCLF